MMISFDSLKNLNVTDQVDGESINTPTNSVDIGQVISIAQPCEGEPVQSENTKW